MIYRNSIMLRYRIFALLAALAVVALSCVAGFFAFGQIAHAEETAQNEVVTYTDNAGHDQVFGVNHAKATDISTAAEVESLSSGTYCLTDDIKLNGAKSFSYGDQIKLCLHGHSLYLGYNWIFKIYGGAEVSIYDCGGTGTISSQMGNTVQGGTLNLYGGAITGGSGGHAVSIFSTTDVHGIFNMYGGSVRDNAGGGAPAVEIGATGIFNMYGGTITGNSTTHSYGGAGVYMHNFDSEFHMYGGTITGNITDCSRASNSTKASSYNGAGVNFKTGKFTIEGDAKISGNIKKDGEAKEINNVYVSSGNAIEISGKLGDNAQIGVTAEKGAFTSKYTSAGNTVNPSTYFTCDGGLDSGLKIGYDSTGKEAAVLDGSDPGVFVFDSAKIVGAPGATVGNTEVTLSVEVTLVNTNDRSKKQYDTVPYDITLDEPLHGGNNPISVDFTYKGETRKLAYVIIPAKLRVKVTWGCEGGKLEGIRYFKRGHDGSDALTAVYVTFTDLYGETKTITGSTASSEITAKDDDGNVIESTAEVGVYKFYLAPSVDYDFDYDSCTVEVVSDMPPVEQGYDKMTKAVVVGVVGTPGAGDKKITVKLTVTLKNTETGKETTKTVNHPVTLENALKAGTNKVSFAYKYTDAKNGVQTANLSVNVTVGKKQVAVKWYFNGSLAKDNAANHVYDGVDESAKIVAEYDGIDGTKQNVNGTAMLKKDKNGKSVTSLKEIGEYTLSLKADDNYEFTNNSFSYIVVEDLSAISDLVYREAGTIIMGVSSNIAFEKDTELKVENATGISSSVVDGDIKKAYNVSFVKGASAVEPAGNLTVYVLIPDDLRNKTYKIFNLKDGVATELNYTANGDYATFETDDLTCILFVESKTAPPIDVDPNNPPSGDGDSPIIATIDGDGLIWLWVVLVLIVVVGLIIGVTLIVKAKRDKKK